MAREIGSLGELLLLRAELQPDMEGFTFVRRRGAESAPLSYASLAARVERVASALREHSAEGSVVACVLPPGIDFLVGFFACAWAGLIAVPVAQPSPGGDRSGFDHILRQSRAQVILTDAAGLEAFGPCRPGAVRWVAIEELEAGAGAWRGPVKADVAYLQYTSGSTGRPKGIMISHEAALDNSRRIRDRFGHSVASRGVIWLPPHHDMGLVGGILQPLFVGFPVHLMSPQEFIRSPLTWLQLISRVGATTSGGPNFAFEACLRRIPEAQRSNLDLTTWDLAFTGAEPISAPTLQRFADGFSVAGFRREAFYPCYGLGECTLMATGGAKGEGITTLEPHGRPGPLVDCGPVIDDHQILVVDPRRRVELEEGETGEIWITGPSLALGYWRNVSETRRVFAARLSDGRGPFLRTGDLGFLQGGRLVVSGRVKSSIVVRGVSHQLEDIERTVRNSHPDLNGFLCAACVTGPFGAEDLVILQECPRADAGDLIPIVEGIRSSVIARHGVSPAHIHVLRSGKLPRTASGKINRPETKHLVLDLSA